MAAAVRTVRLKLPRPLLARLAAQARAKKQSVPTLILRAVRADLRAGHHVDHPRR